MPNIKTACLIIAGECDSPEFELVNKCCEPFNFMFTRGDLEVGEDEAFDNVNDLRSVQGQVVQLSGGGGSSGGSSEIIEHLVGVAGGLRDQVDKRRVLVPGDERRT